MKIVADKDIPFVDPLFQHLGDIHLLPGRDITSDSIKDADALIVRTITPVNQALLKDSRVSFVATATAGKDHVDEEYLRNANIQFSSAPGCNARAVAEYVLSALMILAEQHQFSLQDKTVGIIGCGHVGSLVKDFLHALDISCLINDPPLHEAGVNMEFCELKEVLQADIISIHTPLITKGPYTTLNMVDEEFLATIKSDAILINTSRGQVVDEQALLAYKDANPDFKMVLDVWNNEPGINIEVLKRAALSTPHIAGYTYDAKLRATQMVYQAVCLHFGHDVMASALQFNYPETETEINISHHDDEMDIIQLAILTCYDARSVSASLRTELDLNDEIRPRFFDELRKASTSRREFPSMTIDMSIADTATAEKLRALGFKTMMQAT